jgi:DNA-binding winged helix-turn-helix (wHTH) protein
MPQSFLVGNRRVEPELNTITGLHESTRIEPKVMQVLICLAEHAGRVVPKERRSVVCGPTRVSQTTF